MRFLAAVVAALCLAGSFVSGKELLNSRTPLSENAVQDMFTSFMKQYNKRYTHDEFSGRYQIFKTNIEIIREHNAASNANWTMGVNEFADLNFDEFKAKYFGYEHVSMNHLRNQNLHEIIEAPPATQDWRTANAVTPIKNQGMCGSCWAFSATGSVEGAWVIQGKHTLTSLSEQQLVDCATAEGNQGCNGGLMDYAFQYIIDNKGICSESAYPYTGTDGTCKKTCTAVTTISGFKDIPSGDENSLYNAVGTVGPISVAIEADQQGFQFYSGGVFDGTCGTNLDHGVLAIGYGVDTGKNYFIVKNSWGTSWGEAGFIRMIRGKNQCGISLAASYPTV